MIPETYKIHPQFKLNGISFSSEDLKEVAYSLVKEGADYEVTIGDFLLDWLSNGHSIVVTTSGSSGKPKELVLEKEYMVNSAMATGQFFGIKDGDSALHCLPTDFIAGKMMLVRAMVLGLELDCVAPSSEPLKDAFKSYDFCAMVPLQLENSIHKIDLIKTLIVGGAPLSANQRKTVQNIETKVYETYGMTETSTHIAVKQVNCFTSSETETYFNTLPDITVTKDKRDCLVINAPQIAKKPIITNDMVELISDNRFKWLGRYDNIVNSGGIKLIPEQIEEKLTPIIHSRFFVAGLPDGRLGEKLVLVVEGVIEKDVLYQKIESLTKLQKFEVPKEIHVIKKFEETENGKIQRMKILNLLPH